MNPGRKLAAVAAVLLLPLLLAACQAESKRPSAEAGAPEKQAVCNRDAADALVGKDRVTDEQAKKLTGATLVRQINPNSPVTMDFRQERVTIETDPASNKIVRAYCG